VESISKCSDKLPQMSHKPWRVLANSVVAFHWRAEGTFKNKNDHNRKLEEAAKPGKESLELRVLATGSVNGGLLLCHMDTIHPDAVPTKLIGVLPKSCILQRT